MEICLTLYCLLSVGSESGKQSLSKSLLLIDWSLDRNTHAGKESSYRPGLCVQWCDSHKTDMDPYTQKSIGWFCLFITILCLTAHQSCSFAFITLDTDKWLGSFHLAKPILHIHMWTPDSSVFLSFYLVFLRHSLCVNPGLSDSAPVVGQKVPGNLSYLYFLSVERNTLLHLGVDLYARVHTQALNHAWQALCWPNPFPAAESTSFSGLGFQWGEVPIFLWIHKAALQNT